MARGFIEGEYQDGEIRGLTFLAGMRGMGKTTETARLLSQCAGGALFFDTTGNHPFKGYKTFTQPDDLVKYLKANHNRRFRIRYVTTDEHAEEHFVRVCSIVRWARWMVFAVDEVDTFCGPEHGAKQMPMPLYNLAHFGRHYRVSMLVTARDPASLSIKSVRSAAPCGYFASTKNAISNTSRDASGGQTRRSSRRWKSTNTFIGNPARLRLDYAADVRVYVSS